MESEFIKSAQTAASQNLGAVADNSTSRDEKGNVVQTRYQLDCEEIEATGSTQYDDSLSSSRALTDESLSKIDEEGEPEILPFDRSAESPPHDVENPGSPLRKSLIDAVKDESNQIMDMIENAPIVKVNAFNGADQEEADQFVQSFWYWRDYSSYLLAFFVMTAILTVFTFICKDSKGYQIFLGVMSSLIEALLGLPQLSLNYQKKSTHGLAFLLIAMWTWGDFYKFIYYISIEGPAQLITCSIF